MHNIPVDEDLKNKGLMNVADNERSNCDSCK
jgi:hypothetical protein